MNTHRKLSTLFATLLLSAATAASADIYSAPQKIREVPDYPHDPRHVEVEIWTDRGDGSRYCAGESIEVFFRTNVDAWVAIYNLDTRGRMSRLFPSRHATDNFVRGGVTHRLPARYGYHFEVEGPSGWETLRAVASTSRRALRDFDRYRRWDNLWRDDGDRAPARYRPASLPASDRVQSVPNKIREVPNHPRYDPEIVIADTRHYVRDGYRCRIDRSRPWWHRR